MWVTVLEFVLVAPSKFRWEAFLNFLVSKSLADPRVDFVQILQSCAWSGDVLNSADGATKFGGPNLQKKKEFKNPVEIFFAFLTHQSWFRRVVCAARSAELLCQIFGIFSASRREVSVASNPT